MYHIQIKKSALKELNKISAPFKQNIIKAIDDLAQNPRPDGVKKKGDENAWRIRVGDYRVIYAVEDVIQIVEVYRIRHRRDVYRDI